MAWYFLLSIISSECSNLDYRDQMMCTKTLEAMLMSAYVDQGIKKVETKLKARYKINKTAIIIVGVAGQAVTRGKFSITTRSIISDSATIRYDLKSNTSQVSLNWGF